MGKTIIQELIESMERANKLGASVDICIELANDYLDKERNQIESAYNQGCADTDNKQDGNEPDYRNCIDYFDKTYSNNNITLKKMSRYL